MAIGSPRYIGPAGSDHRTYRGARGIRGDDPRMVGDGPRVAATTSEARLPPAAAAKPSARTAFDPNSVGFAVLVLMALLFVIHARFSVSAQAGVGAGVGTRGKRR